MSASRTRASVVWETLEPLLGAAPRDVLDIGGGTGGFAVRIAEAGHRVTVVDPSPDALSALDRRAREVGVTVTAHQGDLSDLGRLGLGPASVDVVLCHGVLEVVSDPAVALSSLAEVLRPDGILSLLVAQRYAAVVARAMAGHLDEALGLLDSAGPQGRVGRRFTAEELADLVQAAGLSLTSLHGVRVFADLVPGSLQDADHHATVALLELERAVAGRPEFLALATQLHLMATPSGLDVPVHG